MVENSVVENHIPLVKLLVGKYLKRKHRERDELLSDGMLGLAKAAERFNPAFGTKFSTIAYHYIKGEIREGIRRRQPLTRKEWREGIEPPIVWSIEVTPKEMLNNASLSKMYAFPDRERLLKLHTAVAQEDDTINQKIVEVLQSDDGYGSWNQLAKELGMRRSAVFNRKKRLLEQLRRAIEQ